MKNTDWKKITQRPLTSFDFKSVESAFGMPMRYANNSSHLAKRFATVLLCGNAKSVMKTW